MGIKRQKNWTAPKVVQSMDDVQDYLRRHYQDHIEESFTRIRDFGSMLFLDQTTSQTVLNGIPLLDQTYDNFSKLTEFVNKGYVDWAVTAIGVTYYMTDDTDSDTGYKVCSLTPSAGGETYTEVSSIIDDQLLGTWISDVGEAPSKLLRGIYDWLLFAEKTAGTKTLRLYWKLYERKSDDSEVLVATSAESNELDLDVKTSYIVPLVLDSDYNPDDGSRIVGKVYAAVSGSGNAPTVKIYYQGTSGSRWEIPANTEVLSDIFIKREDIGTADGEILKSDGGLTDDQIVRATADGLESRTNAQILTQLGIDGALDITNKTTKATAKCRVYLSSDQTIQNETFTKIAFDSEDYDPGSNFDTTNNKYVVPVTGYYLVILIPFLKWLDDQKKFYVRVIKNTTEIQRTQLWGNVFGTLTNVNPGIYYFSVNDEITGEAYHNHGSSRDLISGSDRTSMSIHLLSV